MSRRGMTLIEVLIAMAIFLFGVTSLLALFHFGGDQEQQARSHAELAPHLENLIEDLVDQTWLLEADGSVVRARLAAGRPVPGAPDYRYDLVLDPAGDPALPRAELLVWRGRADRPLARIPFLLPRAVPVERRLEAEETR
ncbi:MAG: type II secretion system protein [Planctomycetota bacterium]|nr:MAG: type II secretion system protein [Planctomycetota bacterium]